jgi:thioredoxin-dependent peroxiredoxin
MQPMAVIHVGDKAPPFTAQTHAGGTAALADLLGNQVVVLFFYPRDGTPVCTAEACAFRDAYESFTSAGATVIGISGDSLDRHRDFAQQQKLPFLLISDADGALRKAFGVPKTLGVFPGRVTYVIDRQGVVRHIFNSQFSAGQHVSVALNVVQQLQTESA